MSKGTFLATVALLIAVAGAIVAFAAYFKRRSCAICDDFEDEMLDDDLTDLDYYATQVEEADEDTDMDLDIPFAAAPQTTPEPQEEDEADVAVAPTAQDEVSGAPEEESI